MARYITHAIIIAETPHDLTRVAIIGSNKHVGFLYQIDVPQRCDFKCDHSQLLSLTQNRFTFR